MTFQKIKNKKFKNVIGKNVHSYSSHYSAWLWSHNNWSL